VFVALVNLVGTRRRQDILGRIDNHGALRRCPRGRERRWWDETIMTITLDPLDLTRARSDAPLLTDLQTMMPHLMRTVDRIQAASGWC